MKQDDNSTKLVAVCKKVLENNWQGDYTIPAEGLYPHQWLWDSCFVTIGKATYDVKQAKKELTSLLRGQWSNGMLPNIIFASHDKHSRDRRIWQSWRNPNAPDDLNTSGITQPPLLAEAVVRIGNKLKMVERRSWYQDMYPSLLAYHQWLYRERDPHQEGLVLLIHPWESGLDSSPPWINQLHMHSRPWWVTIVEKTHTDALLYLFRRDTLHVPPGQRLNNIDALLYFTVLQRLRRKNWDIEAILNRSHFAVEDLCYNSILIRANEHLRTISKTIGHTLPQELLDSMERSRYALDMLWDGYYKQYFSRNFYTHKLIKEPSISALMPLYSGAISPERAEELVSMLRDTKLFNTPFPVPSVPLASNYYAEMSYWQGPSWLNTNWLIIDGLERYGYKEEARLIRDASIALVTQHGPYEYYSAKTGAPAGAVNFSWSAALTLDMLANS